MALTAKQVREAKPRARVYSIGDGRFGLMLKVAPNGSKRWEQAVRIQSKRCSLGIGPYKGPDDEKPILTLSDARDMALENYRTIKKGGDPRKRKPTAKRIAVPTVWAVAEEIMEQRRLAPGTRLSWKTDLNANAARILNRPVTHPTTRIAHDILAPVWHSKPASAKRVKRRLQNVMDVAVARGLREDNPFDSRIEAALGKQRHKTKNHDAVHHSKVAETLAALKGNPRSRLAIEFAVLTNTREGEAAGALWSEIDADARTWRIAAERRKTRSDLVVPLSEQALEVLRRARALSASNRVFGVRPDTLSSIVTRSKVGCTMHGFRTSFRTWCQDTGVDRELAESAMGHVVGGVEGAYARSDLLERRRELMQDWGDYVGGA